MDSSKSSPTESIRQAVAAESTVQRRAETLISSVSNAIESNVNNPQGLHQLAKELSQSRTTFGQTIASAPDK